MDVSVSNTASGNAAGLALPQGGIQLVQLAKLLRRYAWLIAICAVLGMVAAYSMARLAPKSYTASSLIAVEGDRFAIPELQGALRSENAPDPMPWVRTEMQAITSRDLVQIVVDKLRLRDLPEFNAALRPPTLLQEVKQAIGSLLPKEPAAANVAGPDEAILSAVDQALKVFQDNRSLVIEVSFTSLDPKLSSDVVNTLVAQYIASRANRRVMANRGANTAMTERIDQVRLDLAAIEKQMRDLRDKSEMVGLRAGSVGQQQLEELASAATRASVERAQLQTNYERAAALAKQGSSDALANVLNSATISRLRDQEATAANRVAQLSSSFGSGYPGVRSAQAELASAQRQMRDETQRIVSSLSTQLRAAREHEGNLQKQLEDARRTGVTEGNARALLEQLQQEATTRRSMYQTLLERAQQTVVQPSGTETPDVRVVSQAAPPAQPSSPNMKIAAAAGGLAGGLLGCLLTLTRTVAAGFANAEDLTALTGMPVAAALARARLGRGRNRLLSRIATSPRGAEAEALRGLRSRIAYLGHVSVPRCVVVAGIGDAEEATEIAAALARIAALDGDRVLLIEGNLQQPRAASLLGTSIPGETAEGLLAVLENAGDWRNLLIHDPATPLHTLTVSQAAPRSQALLGGVAFQNLLVEAQPHYDLIVLTAPEATGADALTLAQRADATVLVVDAAATPREPARAVAARLRAMSRNPVVAMFITR